METPGTAGTTPAAAASTGTTLSANDMTSFLGVEPETLPSLQPEQNPEPTGVEAETAAETEVEEVDQELASEGLETEVPETQEVQEEETPDDWLPTEQEKEFPLDVLVKFGKRYGYTPEEIQADPRLQNTLKDKLNSDIYIAQFNQDEQNIGLEETTPRAEETPAETTANATPTDPRAAYYQRVDGMISQLDQKSLNELGTGLLQAFGVNTDVAKLDQMLANPKLSPEQRAEVQGAKALTQNAAKVGQTLARGAVDLILSTLPSVLPEIMEAVAPGLLTDHASYRERSTYASAWQEVTSKPNPQTGQPIYSNLPTYGTKEFGALVRKAESQLGLQPGALGAMVFRGVDGKPLPAMDQARQAYALVAKVASGQRVAPAVVQRAVSAGRQQERTQQQRRAVGGALGAGQTSRQFEQSEETDPIRDALHEEIVRQNSQGNPFRGAREVS